MRSRNIYPHAHKNTKIKRNALFFFTPPDNIYSFFVNLFLQNQTKPISSHKVISRIILRLRGLRQRGRGDNLRGGMSCHYNIHQLGLNTGGDRPEISIWSSCREADVAHPIVHSFLLALGNEAQSVQEGVRGVALRLLLPSPRLARPPLGEVASHQTGEPPAPALPRPLPGHLLRIRPNLQHNIHGRKLNPLIRASPCRQPRHAEPAPSGPGSAR